MVKKIYLGDLSNKAVYSKKGYIGINNVARKLKKGYIGINNIARQFYSSQTFAWRKYAITYDSESVEISGYGRQAAISNTTRYFGTSYTLNTSTGAFTVAQTTSRTRANTKVGDYFINLRTSSGTVSGTELKRINGYDSSTYDVFYDIIIAKPLKGAFIENVENDDPFTYPIAGVKGGYYYEMYDPNHLLTYTGNISDNISYEDSIFYRYVELLSSGSLSLDNAATMDVWLCGAGGNGSSEAFSLLGGAGGFSNQVDAISVKDATVVIGAAGSIGGSSSFIISESELEGSTTTSRGLGAFTLLERAKTDTIDSAVSYFSSLVGKGVSNTTTTTNYGTGSSSYTLRFTYHLGITLPPGSIIDSITCQINGHAQSTSNTQLYVQLKSGNTELSEQINFRTVSTSNTTITLTATTLPTVAELSNMVLECTIGRYGGAINGATCSIQYRSSKGISAGGGNSAGFGSGGTGAGGDYYLGAIGYGDGISKVPFNSPSFTPYCDGGGAGGYYGTASGGAGGTDGSNGSAGISNTSSTAAGGLGGGLYGGSGGYATYGLFSVSVANGGNATGYGSGGGTGGLGNSSSNFGSPGSGYQGACILRMPLVEGEVYEDPSTSYTPPSGYTLLSYVESTGAQTVDLGATLNTNHRIFCDYSITNSESYNIVFSAGAYYRTVFYQHQGNYLRLRYGSYGSETVKDFSVTGSTSRVQVEITNNEGKLYYNNNIYKISGTFFEPGSDYDSGLQLFFGFTGRSNEIYYGKARIYSFKLYNGDNLVLDLVPAKNSSNVAGLLDRKNGSFFNSTSGTALVAGSAI